MLPSFFATLWSNASSKYSTASFRSGKLPPSATEDTHFFKTFDLQFKKKFAYKRSF